MPDWIRAFKITGPNEWLYAMETAREVGARGSEDDAAQEDATSVSNSCSWTP